MRTATAVLLSPIAVGALVLAGCTPASVPEVSPTPGASASPTPTASPAETPVALPDLEQVLALLDTAPGDDRTPPTRLGVVLEPGQPQSLTDARSEPTGPATVRVSCSSVDGQPVRVTVDIGGAERGSFEASCGEAPGVTFTTQEARFDFESEYSFWVEASVPAVVAVGVVPD